LEVVYSDESVGDISSREWTFEGGVPSVSSKSDTIVKYDSLGSFDVKLVVSNGSDTDSVVKSNYIDVTKPQLNLNSYDITCHG
ncbi:MAG: PKD domain-containing protein, partial [Flavobacteriales bacterium]